jgi:hypothetical protein
MTIIIPFEHPACRPILINMRQRVPNAPHQLYGSSLFWKIDDCLYNYNTWEKARPNGDSHTLHSRLL